MTAEKTTAGLPQQKKPGLREWESASENIDALASPVCVKTRFDEMTRGEIKLDRVRTKGLI